MMHVAGDFWTCHYSQLCTTVACAHFSQCLISLLVHRHRHAAGFMFNVLPLDVVAHSTITCPSKPMSHGAIRPLTLRLQIVMLMRLVQ